MRLIDLAGPLTVALGWKHAKSASYDKTCALSCAQIQTLVEIYVESWNVPFN